MGDEFYAIQRYAVDRSANEIYATDRYGNQLYLKVNQKEVCAKKNDGKYFYAKNSKGEFVLPTNGLKPYYIFDQQNHPVYPDGGDGAYGRFKSSEIYPNDASTDIYAKNLQGDQLYAGDARGHFYYASKRTEDGRSVQFYAVDRHGQNIYLYDFDEVRYLLDDGSKPIYAKVDEREIYQTFNGKQTYGRTGNRLPIYAKDGDREYFALDETNEPYYSSYENTQFYPKHGNEKQFYLKLEKKEYYANMNKDVQYYAKNAQLGDILARDGDKPYYCKDHNVEKYPTNADGHQFYKIENNEEVLASSDDAGVSSYYAERDDGQAFYPMSFETITDLSFETIDNLSPTE